MADLKLHAEKNMLLLALTGSHCYGLADEQSDLDYRGIFFEPMASWLGNSPVEQIDSGWESYSPALFPELQTKDVCLYGLRKFVKLATGANPNILELLFTKCIVIANGGRALCRHRGLFLSGLARKTFHGYAYSQLKRIQHHKAWLLSGAEKPNPEDYGLIWSKEKYNGFIELAYALLRNALEYAFIADSIKEQLLEQADFKKAIQSAGVEQLAEIIGTSEEIIKQYMQTKAYFHAKTRYDAYHKWRMHRNKARAELETKIGYDCKHGSHCLRLLAMAIELLGQGQLIVDRREAGDAEYLLSVKRGKVSFEEFSAKADELFAKLDNVQSVLPEKPDYNAIESLLIEIAQNELQTQSY